MTSTTWGQSVKNPHKIEHAVVDHGSGKAECVAAAVERHIRKGYSAVDGAKVEPVAAVCDSGSAADSGGGMYTVLIIVAAAVVASL